MAFMHDFSNTYDVCIRHVAPTLLMEGVFGFDTTPTHLITFNFFKFCVDVSVSCLCLWFIAYKWHNRNLGRLKVKCNSFTFRPT